MIKRHERGGAQKRKRANKRKPPARSDQTPPFPQLGSPPLPNFGILIEPNGRRRRGREWRSGCAPTVSLVQSSAGSCVCHKHAAMNIEVKRAFYGLHRCAEELGRASLPRGALKGQTKARRKSIGEGRGGGREARTGEKLKEKKRRLDLMDIPSVYVQASAGS